jgi:hypothetical protein
MMNFFTKLLTPVFIALGMANPTPVIETPTPDVQVQQELIELRQKVQELENQNEPELESETQEVQESIVETKPVEVKKEAVEARVVPVVQSVVKVEPVEVTPVEIIPETIDQEAINVQIAYEDKLIRFYDKVEKIQEEHGENKFKLDSEYERLDQIKKETEALNRTYDEYELSLQLDYVDIECGAVPQAFCDNQIQKELNNRRSWLLSYSQKFKILEEEFNLLVIRKNEGLDKLNKRYISDVKNLQEQWSIKTEDWIY